LGPIATAEAVVITPASPWRGAGEFCSTRRFATPMPCHSSHAATNPAPAIEV
jgi:hypothetical protein